MSNIDDQMISFVSTYGDPNKRIDNMMSDENEAAFHKNRSIITSIIKDIEIFGRRAIVFRGKQMREGKL